MAVAALALWSGPADAAEPKVVVELFTSQGCSSCPPADALLSELAARDDVVALSFHVDYWNYIGWRDPFSDSKWTERQRGYSRALKRRYVYTPQIVIDGAAESVGSKRGEVERLITAAKSGRKLAIEVAHLEKDRLRIRIPGNGSYDGAPATVWLAFYDSRRSTSIRSGENRGVTLTNTNVVRSMKPIGTWRGEPLDIDLTLAELGSEGRDGCAVLVQAGPAGRIIGATTIPLDITGR